MSQVVAINGDCLTTGTDGYTCSGIIYFDALKISVGGTKVITKATCIFTHPTGPPAKPPIPVILLPAGVTKLKDNSVSVLRVGDTQTTGGQTLYVDPTITNKLKSA